MPSLSELQRRFAAAMLDLGARTRRTHGRVSAHDFRQLSQRARRHLPCRARAHRQALLRRGRGRLRRRASVDRRRSQCLRRRVPGVSGHVPARRAIAVPSGCGAARMGDGRRASRCRRRRRRAAHALRCSPRFRQTRSRCNDSRSIRHAGCCARRFPCCASGRRISTQRLTTFSCRIRRRRRLSSRAARRRSRRRRTGRSRGSCLACARSRPAPTSRTRSTPPSTPTPRFDLGTALRTYIATGTLTGIVDGDRQGAP